MWFANIQILPSFHTCIHEEERTLLTQTTVIANENLWFSTWRAAVNTSRDDKQNRSRAVFKVLFGFFCKTFPTFHFSDLLHPEGFHRGELCRAALQEDSSGPQRKGLALLLSNPVSVALSRVSGYRLLAPASSCNFSVVEKRDTFFSEPLGAISRQCRRCQFLSSRGSHHFKETVWNYRDVRWCPWLMQRSVKSIIVLQRNKNDRFILKTWAFASYSDAEGCWIELLPIAFWKDEGAAFSSPAINFLNQWKAPRWAKAHRWGRFNASESWSSTCSMWKVYFKMTQVLKG